MKTKTTPWTAAEDAALEQAARDNVSAERLCVRMKRSVGSIKRRMRELGLRGSRRKPRESHTVIRIVVNPLAQVAGWLKACKSGDLVTLMGFYSHDAMFECACDGAAVLAGLSAIQEYWAPKLRSADPRSFNLESARIENGRVRVDYLSYQAKPVRMFVSFDPMGKIIHSECGPRGCTRIAA